MKIRSYLTFGLIASAMLLAASTAHAITYYVTTTGNDANAGTPSAAFRTIGKGIAASTNGDIVSVAAGTYVESLNINQKAITLRGAGQGATILDGTLKASGGDWFLLTLTGFTVRNGGLNLTMRCIVGLCTIVSSPGDAIYSRVSGLRFPPPRFLDVVDCSLSSNAGAGIDIIGEVKATSCRFQINDGPGIKCKDGIFTVIGCEFVGNYVGLATSGYPVDLNVDLISTVTNCTFDNNRGTGMANGVYGTTITKCIFSGNHGDGILNNGAHAKMINCSFQGNVAGVRNGPYRNPTITQCTFTGNDYGIANNQCNPTLINCILWGDSLAPFFNESGSAPIITYSDIAGGYPGIGNIDADPLFVGAGSLSIQYPSACIDAGSAAAPDLPTSDLAGRTRIQGSAPDMGAYESDPTTYALYVDNAVGKDANGGTPQFPFASVVKAISVARSGDRIFIKAGNYGTDKSRITKAVNLRNWGNSGLSRIGQP